MRLLIIILFTLFHLLQVNAQDCTQLPSAFTNYTQATQMVRQTYFRVKESVNTAKSSWIRGAEYYSCDGKTGYFILTTDKHPYIYQDMPIEIWNGFKETDSFGSYYNSFIKGQWQMIL